MKNSIPTIFLDANVLIQQGKEGTPVLERLVDLVDAQLVSIVTTSLTMQEVAKKHVENDLNVVKEFTRPHFRAILNEALGIELPKIEKVNLKESLVKKYEKSTKKLFAALEATVLSIDDVLPSEVLNAYSNREGFFSGEGKKDQFPDAFIFACLQKKATDETPIVIVSSDNDFVAPTKNSKNITLVKSFPDLFKKLGLEIEAPEVAEFLEEKHDELVSSFEEELDKWELVVSDVQDAEIDAATVTNVKLDHLTSFKSTVNGGSILVAGYATVTAAVSYTHPNWDTASWDSEDKVAIPWEDVSGDTEVELKTRFSLSVSVDGLGKPVALDNLSFIDASFLYVEIGEPYDHYK